MIDGRPKIRDVRGRTEEQAGAGLVERRAALERTQGLVDLPVCSQN